MKKEDVIKSEVQEFYNHGEWKGSRTIPTAQDLINGLKVELKNHWEENQITYLNELIRLINVDVREHLKDCKHKNNPDNCPTIKFYIKSEYYINQLLDTLKEKIKPDRSQLNEPLSTKTLDALQGLLNGEPQLITKDTPKEISKTITRLNNLGFLIKDSYKYFVHHSKRKYLRKLIKLKSWKKFNDWLDLEEEKDSNLNIINNIHNSTRVQINHAIGGSSINEPSNKVEKSANSKWVGILTVTIMGLGLLWAVIKYFL